MKISDFNSFLREEWLPFLNTNLKWGVSIFLRAMFIILTIIMIILLLKVSGIMKDLRNIAMQDILNVNPQTTTTISIPEINYSSDIEELNSLINSLEKPNENSK